MLFPVNDEDLCVRVEDNIILTRPSFMNSDWVMGRENILSVCHLLADREDNI